MLQTPFSSTHGSLSPRTCRSALGLCACRNNRSSRLRAEWGLPSGGWVKPRL